ncbi:MAG: anti-sigma regulatory factor [Deltaproteobacteria bacterium]|nr:anti-sigma regulatory factor [Deltaproteobacteria bacterium]
MKTRLKKKYVIKRLDFARAGEASINVKNLLKSLNVDSKLTRRVSICGYEGEMNVVMHGGDGTLCVEITNRAIVLNISDNGPGIEDIEMAMTKGFSTASQEHREMGFGAGMGLPNMKKNSDEIVIQSEKWKKTNVKMTFSIPGKGE